MTPAQSADSGCLRGRRVRNLFLAACACATLGVSEPAVAATKLSIGYSPILDSLTTFAAKDKGIFAKHDLDVELVSVQLNSNMPAAILSGSLSLGSVNAAVFLQAVDGGLDLQIVQNVSMLPNHDAIIAFAARADIPFDSGKSMEGKRVSIPGLGSSAHILFEQWLAMQGGDPKKVTPIELASAQANDALRGKVVDGAVAVEPFVTRIVQSGSGKVIGRLTDGLPKPIVAISYIAERSWIEKNGATLAAVRASLLEAIGWVKANPGEARGLITTYLKLPKEVVDALPLPLMEDKITEADLMFWIDAMKSSDRLRTAPEPARLIAK
jgi:NitT/TauT family transport system substrate-binding protein